METPERSDERTFGGKANPLLFTKFDPEACGLWAH